MNTAPVGGKRWNGFPRRASARHGRSWQITMAWGLGEWQRTNLWFSSGNSMILKHGIEGGPKKKCRSCRLQDAPMQLSEVLCGSDRAGVWALPHHQNARVLVVQSCWGNCGWLLNKLWETICIWRWPERRSWFSQGFFPIGDELLVRLGDWPDKVRGAACG